ncbi:hypothetical protein BBD41_02355 [Paenibacillus ihbetae]|uniref:Uncharacterized protein n=1 Tax=Paenibacillus ihbetae TaxID=1870820 RepID=A0A1B2DUY6_9BACL|nr:hypothetical protein [Paenibacillus ihbetae]ANY71511.1 hypothetical protein BBD41_02355 [Paenibacillus ihbetae]
MPSRRKRPARSRSESAKRWVGHPVVVVLKDGSCYIGELNKVHGKEVTLSGFRVNDQAAARIARSGDRARISGLFSDLFGAGAFSGGSPAAAEAAPGAAVEAENRGGPGPLGFIGDILPHIKLGVNVIQSIMPLLNMMKI